MRLTGRSRNSLHHVFAALIFLGGACGKSTVSAQWSPASPPMQPVGANDADQNEESLAAMEGAFARLIAAAIPPTYEKKEDWGATKNITVGLRTEGKGLKTKIRRRKKPVDHGVWKHYRITAKRPAKGANVRVSNLRVLGAGRVGLTLVVDAQLEYWARAKVYQYGVHLIALEVVGDADAQLTMDCEVAIQLRTNEGDFGAAVVPQVKRSQLNLREFRIRRVSNAHGPLVRELGSGVRRLIEHELDGEALTAKLNRAIEKKRDRLEYSVREMLTSEWRWLAELADISPQPAAH